NSMINRVGSTFVHRLQDETGAAAPDVVRAYLITREAFGLVELWQAVEALDYKVPDRIQTAMVIDAGRLILRASLWFLRNRSHLGMLSADNHWQTLAKAALRDDLASMLRALSADALRASASRDDASPSDPAALITAWKARNSVLYERFRQVLADLRSSESLDLAMLSVAMRELRNLSSR